MIIKEYPEPEFGAMSVGCFDYVRRRDWLNSGPFICRHGVDIVGSSCPQCIADWSRRREQICVDRFEE